MAESCCGTYLLQRIPTGIQPKNFFTTYTLDSSAAFKLQQGAQDDARRYTYNAIASLLGAFTALRHNEYAWATTKLYYSAFYAGRSGLCRLNHIIFHAPIIGSNGFTQFELSAFAGNIPKIVDKPPSTHKLVAKRFHDLGYPRFMTSLEIDGIDPLNWLMGNREYWQYRASRFPDPDYPNLFAHFDLKKANRLLEEYYNDATGLFLSDPEHAMIAVPFRLVAWCLEQAPLISSGTVSEEDLEYLKRKCQVGSLNLTRIRNLLKIQQPN